MISLKPSFSAPIRFAAGTSTLLNTSDAHPNSGIIGSVSWCLPGVIPRGGEHTARSNARVLNGRPSDPFRVQRNDQDGDSTFALAACPHGGRTVVGGEPVGHPLFGAVHHKHTIAPLCCGRDIGNIGSGYGVVNTLNSMVRFCPRLKDYLIH